MTGAPKKTALVEALTILSDGAMPIEHRCREWVSATFAGEWHYVVMRFEGIGAARKAEALSRKLETYEFNLPGTLVADISASNIVHHCDGSNIVVETLLLVE